jgi:Na+-driven multidrug efflux pump
MSLRLGEMNPRGAKQAGEIGILLSFLVLAAIMMGVYFRIRWFGQIFTQDEEFLSLFESVRLPFCGTLFLMNMSVAVERIPYSMGRTREVFWMGLIASWCGTSQIFYRLIGRNLVCNDETWFAIMLSYMYFTFWLPSQFNNFPFLSVPHNFDHCTVAQVPGVYFLTRYWRNDLFGLYCGMALGYLVLMLLYGFITVTSDWQKYAEIARQRSEIDERQSIAV